MELIPILLRFWWAIPIAILTATTAFYKHEAQSNHDQLITYQATVEALGKAQEARNRETIAKQQKVTDDAAKSYQSRLDAINFAYGRLRDEKAASNSRPMPPDANAAKPTNDAARDAELSSVLRQAEIQTGQLIELQEWVRALPR